ncbi:MAG: hypothetical protein IJ397_02880 [Lachnospiraceae bacterium]|nr:hypothetical protein [Lachnospiraceae bacterium]
MNKLKFTVAILSSGLILSLNGCASAIPELTTDEQDMVTQYMADLLLQYDANYQDSLLEEEELTIALEEQREKEEAARLEAEEQERLEQEKIEESKPDEIETDITPSYADIGSMADASNLAGVEFDYLGYDIVSQYPDHSEGELVFAMTPTEGNELLIIKFQLSNVSGTDCAVDMIQTGTSYAIKINDGSYAPALTTLIENDLSTIGTVLPVESGKEVVLISEVPAGTQIDSMILYVRAQDGNLEIQLQ